MRENPSQHEKAQTQKDTLLARLVFVEQLVQKAASPPSPASLVLQKVFVFDDNLRIDVEKCLSVEILKKVDEAYVLSEQLATSASGSEELNGEDLQPYKVGDKVKADINWGRMYRGRIVSVHSNGTYRIDFEDGESGTARLSQIEGGEAKKNELERKATLQGKGSTLFEICVAPVLSTSMCLANAIALKGEQKDDVTKEIIDKVSLLLPSDSGSAEEEFPPAAKVRFNKMFSLRAALEAPFIKDAAFSQWLASLASTCDRNRILELAILYMDEGKQSELILHLVHEIIDSVESGAGLKETAPNTDSKEENKETLKEGKTDARGNKDSEEGTKEKQDPARRSRFSAIPDTPSSVDCLRRLASSSPQVFIKVFTETLGAANQGEFRGANGDEISD